MAAVAVVAVVAALVLLGPAPADARNCQPYNNNKLVQMCGSKYFDLRNIKGQDGSNLLTAMDVQRGNEYFVQFDGSGVPKKLPKCTVDSDTNNLGMQVRLDGAGCYRLGSIDLMIFNFDNATQQFSVIATGGDKGRSIYINTQCTFGADYASLTETGETGNRYNFNLNLPSERCTTSPPIVTTTTTTTTATTTTAPPPSPCPSKAISTSEFAIGTGGAAFAVLAVLATIIFICQQRSRSAAAAAARQDWGEVIQRFGRGLPRRPRIPREINRTALTLLGNTSTNNKHSGGCGAVAGACGKGMLQEHAGIPAYIVAVKALHRRCSAAAREELLDEAMIMAQLSHPHVVELIGVITIGRPVCLVLEYMEHGSLELYLRANTASQNQRMQWAGDCAAGLAHVHAMAFVHGDVAARNVLLSSDLRCKLSNFGLAHETQPDDPCECVGKGVCEGVCVREGES